MTSIRASDPCTLSPVTREPVDIDPAKLAELTAAGEEGQESDETGQVTAGGRAGAAAGAAAATTDGAAAQLALGAGNEGESIPGEDSVSTVDMLELIDQQSDEVALMLRDLVTESA